MDTNKDPLRDVRGIARGVLIGAAIWGIIGLASCQAFGQTTDITGKHYAAGCDRQWCWPSFTLTRQTIMTTVGNPAESHPSGRAYAWTLVSSGPVCRIIMPEHLPHRAEQNGYTMDGLEAHEAWHCMGHDHD